MLGVDEGEAAWAADEILDFLVGHRIVAAEHKSEDVGVVLTREDGATITITAWYDERRGYLGISRGGGQDAKPGQREKKLTL